MLFGILRLISIYYEEDPTVRFPNNWNEIYLLSVNGLSGMLGQTFYTMALQIEEAGIISLVRSIDVVNGFLAQWLFIKKQKVTLLSIAGAAVVLVGLTLAASSKLFDRYQEKQKQRQNRRENWKEKTDSSGVSFLNLS